MLDLLLSFIPGWIVLYKKPMTSQGKKTWERVRKFGCFIFVMACTCLLGGLFFVGGILWDLLLLHQSIDSFELIFRAFWWFVGAFMVTLVEWKLQEERFRLPAKVDTSQ